MEAALSSANFSLRAVTRGIETKTTQAEACATKTGLPSYEWICDGDARLIRGAGDGVVAGAGCESFGSGSNENVTPLFAFTSTVRCKSNWSMSTEFSTPLIRTKCNLPLATQYLL